MCLFQTHAGLSAPRPCGQNNPESEVAVAANG